MLNTYEKLNIDKREKFIEINMEKYDNIADNSNEKQITKGANSMNWKSQDFPKWFQVDVEAEPKRGWKRIFGRGRTKYEDYFISQLRSIYMDLDGDLRTLVPEYSGVTNIGEKNYVDEIGVYIDNLLRAARGILENQKLSKRQMLIASSILNEVEECLVWITPPTLALAHMPDLLSKMASIDSPDKYVYIKMLEESRDILKASRDKNKQLDRSEIESYRSSIEEGINFIYSQTLKDIINTGLQIERLRSLRSWGIFLLVIFIFIYPMVSDMEKWSLYRDTINATINATNSSTWLFGEIIRPWMATLVARYTAISFAIVGAIGGFLSGLLQMRDSKTDLGGYEVSILLFQIRPIFGAFAALISFMLLSWGVLSGIADPSESSYALIAFISGFSERYFIRLFEKMNGDDKISDIPSKEEVALMLDKAKKPDKGLDSNKESDLKPN